MNKIITISREFGSGGREIGKRLADELKLSYYDKEIITEIAKETGMSEEFITNISERGMYPYAFQFAKTFSTYSGIQKEQTDLLIAQNKILKAIAEKGKCIIVGRGASIILNDYKPMNIFVYSDMKSKINRCRLKRSDEQLSDEELENKIKQIDKNRREYHKIISDLTWGDKRNYHLCINTSELEIKKVIPSLSSYIEEWFRRK